MEMEPLYKPHGVEERWQRTWEDEGLYNAEPDPSREPFVDAHPAAERHRRAAPRPRAPARARRHDRALKRMQGFNVLFQPGYDHAGISTQNAVEKALLAEGTSRQELGREAFEARVWDWLREYGGKIMIQFRRMGASLDYRRERFTMDDGYVRAVMRFFVHLYEQGMDLPRQPDHQLVPVSPDVALGSRARGRRGRRHAHDDPLSARGRLGLHRDRDGASGDDPGRRRGGGASRRRALPASRRQGGDRAVRRAACADHRRRARRARLRHRRAEDHARARPEGLRDRPRPRAARDDRDRARRAA